MPRWSPLLQEALKKKTTRELFTIAYSITTKNESRESSGLLSKEGIKDLTELGIPCGPINNIAQVVEDPQIKQRKMIIEIDHPRLKKVKAVNTPLRFSRTQPEIKEPSPNLGQHTDEVLKEWLGLTGEEISQIRSSEVI